MDQEDRIIQHRAPLFQYILKLLIAFYNIPNNMNLKAMSNGYLV